MTRWQAFAVHLGICLVIFAVLVGAILIWWYPDIFFDTDGGWQGVRIIALVDLVLGPCLTLVVYKAGKPGLFFDLTMIGIFQTLCLGAGTWIVYSERPLAMVMVDDIFFSMSADDYTNLGIDVPDLDRFEGRGPKWVTVDLPVDLDAISEVRRSAIDSDQPLRTLHERYIPFSPTHLDFDRAIPLEDLAYLDAQTGGLAIWLEAHGGTLEDYAFFQFGTRYSFVHLGVRRSDRAVLGLLSTPGPG